MKQFVLRIISFSFFSFLILSPFIVIKYTGFDFTTLNGSEVYTSLDKSKKSTSESSRLLLGDSVANQLYPSSKYISNPCSLACNQAITMAGHFFLLHNYIQNNINSLPENVILLYHPQSLKNNTDEYTFHYFLKPFYNKFYKPFFSSTLVNAVHNIPLYWLSQFPPVRKSNWTVTYEPSTGDFVFLSPISRDYILMMSHLLAQYGIDFSIISPPVSEKFKFSYECQYYRAIDRGEFNGLENLLNRYHDSICYYPDSIFTDNIHLKKDCIPSDYLSVLSVDYPAL